jgi:uncharacterized paraquat-inducible protein A
MKVIAKVSPLLTVELEAKDQRDLFEQLYSTQEVFGIDKCGKCGCTDIKYIVRTNKDEDKFYELRCPKCKAKLEFGCHKKGNSLFPKKKSDDGKYLPNNGWTVYVPPAKSE